MSNEPESHAEQLDADELGGADDGTRLPGEDYPPERPLGLGDPGLSGDGEVVTDDVETRSWREQHEADPEDEPTIDPIAETLRDEEPELVGELGDESADPAEVAAMHVIDE
jgi:hypothetical protein